MPSAKFRTLILRALAIVALTYGSVFAELPQTRLWSVMPMGGRLGSDVEIVIEGADLDDAHTVLFSSPAIAAKSKMSGTNVEANHFIVSISTNAPIGRSEIRVAGRFGVSNPRSFVVSDLKEVLETEPNSSPESAQKIELNTVVNGKTDGSATDNFQFHAEKDQRIMIEIATDSIDSKAVPSVTVYNPEGDEIGRSRAKDFLEINTGSAGDYRLEVHDLTYIGGRDYFYRLAIGTFPHIDYISPGIGKPGVKSAQKLYGRNLPGGKPGDLKGADGKPLEEAAIELEFPPASEANKLSTGILLKPASAQIDAFEFSLKNASGTSNPYLLSSVADPVAGQLQSESFEIKEIPFAYSGRFHPGKEEILTFNAKKGEQYTIEVTSDRLGFSSDPFMVLQKTSKNDKGETNYSDVTELYDKDENLGGMECKTSTRDLWYQFKPGDDSQYRILLQDLFNANRGKPSFPYLLSIRKELPDFQLAAFPLTPPNPTKDAKNLPVWSNFLRKGDKIALRLLAFRKGDLKDEIPLSVEGLPTGVTFAPASIKAGQNAVTLILASALDASAFVGPIKIVGTTKSSGAPLTREARACTAVWQVEDYSREPYPSRIARDLTLAVAEKEIAPIAIDPATEQIWETSVANKLQIPLKISRRGDFNNPLKFRVLTEPVKEFEADGKATNATVEIDVNQAKLGVGDHDIIVLAQTSGKYRRLVPEEIKTLEAQVKSANDEIAAIDKEIGALNEQQKSAEEKKKAELAAEVKQKQGKKDSLNGEIKNWNEKLKTVDAACTVYCSPLHIKVTAAPIQFASAPSMSLKRGAKTELTIQMKRLYGYKDPIELTLVTPGDLKGISASKVSIPADQAECKLLFESAMDATMGEKKATLVAVAKLNNQELKIEQPIGITVTD